MSMSRHCDKTKCSDQKWYLTLGVNEYHGLEDSLTYGPFDTLEELGAELDMHANPGAFWEDSSGKHEPPTESPNGEPLQPKAKRFFGAW